ncbi:MAG: asparagine synthase-related protein [Allosphingosinicella sp.]
MTALAGFWHFDGKPASAECCRRMLSAQRIYGPDDTGLWDDGDVALGRCLFRTLPEDRFDRRPQLGGGGRFALVADLRLDNRDELARALGIEGSEAGTLCDAALLMRAWERWESASFDRLVGDYAFALWDGRERRLFLARDALGNRPLHYHRGDGVFAFASMPKGLHALPSVAYAPDQVRAAEFLALMPESGPRSFFEGISRVEAGQLAVVGDGQVRTSLHWQPRRGTGKAGSAGDYAEGLRHHLDVAVAARLRGAGDRVGAHLSGGFDSSAVATTAARLMGERGGGVLALTAVPREGYRGAMRAERIGDESELAGATASLYPNMDHVLVRPNGQKILDELDRDFFLFERPLVNVCNQRWWKRVNEEARSRGVRVVLPAVMGNYSISYPGWERFAELAGTGRWLTLAREGRAFVGSGQRSWKGVLADAFGPWLPAPLWRAASRSGGRLDYDLTSYTAINPQRTLDLERRAAGQAHDFGYRPPKDGFDIRLWCLRRIDFGNLHKGSLAGWGIDQRDPTTDRRLVEYTLALPMEAFLNRGESRAVARRAFADRIPAHVLAERRKGIPAVDWHEQVAASPADLALEIGRLEQVPEAAAALDLARMRGLVESWPSGGWDSGPAETLYRAALLRGIVSGHFLRKAVRSNA